MKYLLDSDHLSILQRPSSPEYVILTGRMDHHPTTDFAASVVSFHEQTLGCHARVNRARRPAEVLRGYELFKTVLDQYSSSTVLPFDAAAAAVFDGLAGLQIRAGTMDRRIPAIAVCRHLILLTRHRTHFAGIPGLVVEDWTV